MYYTHTRVLFSYEGIQTETTFSPAGYEVKKKNQDVVFVCVRVYVSCKLQGKS